MAGPFISLDLNFLFFLATSHDVAQASLKPETLLQPPECGDGPCVPAPDLSFICEVRITSSTAQGEYKSNTLASVEN